MYNTNTDIEFHRAMKDVLDRCGISKERGILENKDYYKAIKGMTQKGIFEFFLPDANGLQRGEYIHGIGEINYDAAMAVEKADKQKKREVKKSASDVLENLFGKYHNSEVLMGILLDVDSTSEFVSRVAESPLFGNDALVLLFAEKKIKEGWMERYFAEKLEKRKVFSKNNASPSSSVKVGPKGR